MKPWKITLRLRAASSHTHSSPPGLRTPSWLPVGFRRRSEREHVLRGKKTLDPHPTLTERRESKIPTNSKVHCMNPRDFNSFAYPTQSSALEPQHSVISQDFPVSLTWSRVEWRADWWGVERALDSHQKFIFRWPFEDMRHFIELPKFPLWHHFCTAEKQLQESIQDLQLP